MSVRDTSLSSHPDATLRRRRIMAALGRIIDTIDTPTLEAVLADLPRRRRVSSAEAARMYPHVGGSGEGLAQRLNQEGAAFDTHRLATALLLDALLVHGAGSGVAVHDACVLVGNLVDEYEIDRLRLAPLTPQQRMRRQWDRIRAKVTPVVMARDGAFCRRCDTTESLTIDHVVPIDLDGTNDLGNLQVLCGPCNSSKGNRLEASR